MNRKSTDELLAILKEKNDYSEFLDECNSEIITSVSTYLNALMSDTTVPVLSRKTYISESYLYKILEGKRTNPSRDTLLQISFGLKLNLEQTNKLLRAGNANTLYAKIKRDSIIIFCISKNKTLQECDEMLFDAGEKTLIKK